MLTCPVCHEAAAVDDTACPHCGFPFTCDISPLNEKYLATRMAGWRLMLGLAALVFFLVSAFSVYSGYDAYHGYTQTLLAQLQPDTQSGIPIEGPPVFIYRTQLALGLLKQRAPDVYWRMQQSVNSIEFLAPTYLQTEEGRRIPLEGIGALATPSLRRIQVIDIAAFPSGPGQIYDRNIFSYAGILVHELRHIELHWMGLAPGGVDEEVLCERAAYAALQQCAASPGLLTRYEIYLSNPHHQRYQKWYKWYEHWD